MFLVSYRTRLVDWRINKQFRSVNICVRTSRTWLSSLKQAKVHTINCSIKNLNGKDHKHADEVSDLEDRMCELVLFVPHCFPFPVPLSLYSLGNDKPNFVMHPSPTCDFHWVLVTFILAACLWRIITQEWNVRCTEQYIEIHVCGVVFIALMLWSISQHAECFWNHNNIKVSIWYNHDGGSTSLFSSVSTNVASPMLMMGACGCVWSMPILDANYYLLYIGFFFQNAQAIQYFQHQTISGEDASGHNCHKGIANVPMHQTILLPL